MASGEKTATKRTFIITHARKRDLHVQKNVEAMFGEIPCLNEQNANKVKMVASGLSSVVHDVRSYDLTFGQLLLQKLPKG
jgi:hypothetical protein